ncbi:hypothetical protein HMPREF9445_01337 [Bacteroides clarus YIT 12056]|uniref:Toxin-antitoxin system, toxin component, PIN domain protein n=1 Tax=Bacteroides clarus YIT 12056 TaxID=762984 RepID=A0ABN0CPU6_9BACE|nr:hypothetical protein HMPREF9445_01337 [Bacteroides clarus YIT 12056]
MLLAYLSLKHKLFTINTDNILSVTLSTFKCRHKYGTNIR